MGDVIRLTLEGPDAEPGKIPVADVTRLLQGYERALGRAAEARIRRQARTGRRGAAVETATRVIFRAITGGSLVAELELPDVVGEVVLELGDDHLGELAASDLQGLIEDPDRPGVDERVADALATLGDELGIGNRYWALTVELLHNDGSVPRRAQFTEETRQRLDSVLRAAASSRARDDRVVGTLVEADFERHTAHVLTSDQRRVAVTFTEDQADEIQTWLRRPGELEGRIEYDARSGTALTIELRRIVHPVQIQAILESEEFFRHRTVAELAAEHHVSAIHDVDALADKGATQEEMAAFLDALAL
jgi:hypothetical protein